MPFLNTTDIVRSAKAAIDQSKVKWIVNANPEKIISCFVINRLTGEIIKFPAFPTDMSESVGVSYSPQTILGRSAPYFSYEGNDARTISFSVKLEDNICPNMAQVVERLKALAYPKYQGSIVRPPYCYVKFGEMVNMNAIIGGVSVSWSGVVLEGSDHLSVADVSFDFTELRLRTLPQVNGVFNEGA